MSTRSSARNLFPPLDNSELTIRRRSRTDPTLLNEFEMAAEGNGDPPVFDLRTIEELCQSSLNGRGGPIALIAIQAMNFGLKNDMIQQSIKVNGVTDDALRLYLFPHSLTHHATAWFDRLPRNSINMFERMAKMFLGKYFPPSMVTKLKNEITNFRQRPDESLFEEWERYKLSIDWCPNHNMLPITQIDTFYNGLTLRHRDTINAATCGTFMKRRPEECYDLIENMIAHHNDWDTSAQRSESSTSITFSFDLEIAALKAEMVKINQNLMRVLQHISNTITNSKKDLKGITTRSETAYQGPTIPTTSSSLPQVVERETEVTNDTVPPTNNGSTKDVQPLVVQVENPKPNSEPVVAPIIKPVVAPANDQKEKKNQIFQDLNFNISFADTLILMPKFGPTIKKFLTNKDKLSRLARTPLNEHCSVVLLKKLPKNLGDLGKFLIPCDFPEMDECLALADLGASINLMPLSVWNKLSLPELSPTYMTLELADRSISRPVGVAKDVFVKVGTFHFLADFIVVDFDVDPRVPLILEGSFIKIGRVLIDVFERELTLRVGKEAITLNLDQTLRYSTNYNDMTAKRIDVIDMACEEYSQEVFGFSDVITSGNPTPYYDPIVSTSSSTLTPFGDSDFLLEEVDAFLALEDDPASSKVDHSYYDTEGDILLLEAFLNDDPSLPHPTQGKYLPQVQKELKICEAKNDKSSIDEPLEAELKDLPPHLEYAFFEGDDKLPVIIAKDFSDEEKTALIKILMEEDFKPAVQHQRRVNPKIHDVIKKEVEKLLDAELIYPISDSPWEKSHFMVKEGIVLSHKISKNKIEVYKEKVDVIAKGTSLLKECRPNKRTNSSKMRSITFGTTTSCSKFVRIKSSGGVFTAKRPLTFSRLATMDPPGDTMARTTPPKRVVPVFTREQNIFVAVNYLSKWVEVKALPTNNARVVCKFLKFLFSMFETPLAIISDRGMHFCNDQLLKYGVTHRLATAYHPQTSGQVEVTNHGLKRILERTLGENRASWSDKLDDALWAFRTAFKTPIGCTLYKLVYEKACHLPIELEHKAYWALKHANFDLQTAGDHRKVQLNELNELRDQAYQNSLIYKEKTKRLHDSKIKDRVFNVGDRVLLFNSRLKIFLGKLKTRWSGPFTITHVFPYGTVELPQADGPNFKVNGHRLKHYFGKDIPKMVILDLQTFPKDQ
uniref:Reverse transcriptase domain-containing protein n=1 Tax=Tanacetum cinerariifolium TaxID=118510 RepID=A0A6L2L9H0_TANCI|nr:reverse transcriptase domain-containing protein [Tanacetum cinerariifolium]